MSSPLQGEGNIKGTSRDALIILNSDEEQESSVLNRNEAADIDMSDCVPLTADPLDGRTLGTLNSTMPQKTSTKKLFNLSSDKYKTESIYVYIEKTNEQNIGKLHPMYVGHILHKSLKINNILSVRSIGKNRIKVQLKSILDANLLVNNDKLDAENLRAYIPNHLLEKKGLIRGVDTRFDLQYLKDNIVSPAKIINLYRLHRKVENNSKTELIPKQTVVITFEGNITPSAVYINSVICPVEPYLGRVVQCFKCLKYGHVAKQCRGTSTVCIACGAEKLENHICNRESFCIYCKNSTHNSISKNCPYYEKQKRVKTVMSENNLSYNEAKEFSENSFSNSVLSKNKFSLLSNFDYDKDFPNLPKFHNPPPAILPTSTGNNLNKNIRKSYTQPSTSRARFSINQSTNNNNNKKRKIYASPSNSPPVSPMFPFQFGSPTKLSREHSSPYSLPSHVMDTISNFIFDLVKNITSIEDVKKINNDLITKDLKAVLEDTLSKGQ